MRIIIIISTILILTCCNKTPETITEMQYITEEIPVKTIYDFIGTDSESWMNAYLNNDKVGYIYSTVNSAKFNDLEVISMKSYSYLKIQRYENEIVIETTDNLYMDYDLNPVGFTSVKTEPLSGKTTMQGIIRGKSIELVIQSRTNEETKTYTLPDDFSFEGIERYKMLIDGISVGFTQNYSVFDMQELDFVNISTKITGKKEIFYNGENIEVFELSTVYDYGIKIIISEILTANGETISIEMKELGFRFETTTQEDAVSSFIGYELNDESVIPVNQFIPLDTKEMRFKVTASEGEISELFIDDYNQHIDLSNSTIAVQINFTYKNNSIMLPYDFGPEENQFLLPTRFIQSDDEEIIKLAAQIVSGETNISGIVRKIYLWLVNNITGTYEVPFASAKEVLSLGKGDCTEFAVLFAALARASGIPTKVCIGLVYNQSDGFVFHAWNEVFNGIWQPVDAAMQQLYPDATHIKVYSGLLENLSDHSFKVQKIIGNVNFEILDYE